MVEWMPIDEALPLNWENAISLIKNFHKQGLNVIVPYPLSRKNYEFVLSELSDLKNQIEVFTLSPKLEKALINRGNRELNNWEIERIKYHYEIGINNPDFGEIIDNSDITPEEAVDIILSSLNNN